LDGSIPHEVYSIAIGSPEADHPDWIQERHKGDSDALESREKQLVPWHSCFKMVHEGKRHLGADLFEAMNSGCENKGGRIWTLRADSKGLN